MLKFYHDFPIDFIGGQCFCRNPSDDDLERYEMEVSKDFPFHEKQNIEVSS